MNGIKRNRKGEALAGLTILIIGSIILYLCYLFSNNTILCCLFGFLSFPFLAMGVTILDLSHMD